MVDVFISYPRAARTKVEPIKTKLDALGLDCFYDLEGIDGGAEFPAVIDRAVKSAKAVLGCWSPNAFTRPWVMQECRVARARNVLVPVAIEPFDGLAVPTEFFDLNYLDLIGWDGSDAHEGWQRTLHALGKLVRRELAASRNAMPSEHKVEDVKSGAPATDQARFTILADLRSTWMAFPAKDNKAAVEKFLTRARAAAPGSGLEFEVEYHLEEMARVGEQRHAHEQQRSTLAVGASAILGNWRGSIRFQYSEQVISRTWQCSPEGYYEISGSELHIEERGSWKFEQGEFVLRQSEGTIYRGTVDGDIFRGTVRSTLGSHGAFEMHRLTNHSDGDGAPSF